MTFQFLLKFQIEVCFKHQKLNCTRKNNNILKSIKSMVMNKYFKAFRGFINERNIIINIDVKLNEDLKLKLMIIGCSLKSITRKH